jgi:hypothetical protein
MKTINKILEERGIKSPWQGSAKTEEQMREQVKERFGSKVAKEYKASLHVMSLSQWSKFGVKIKPGESCLQTYTLIEDSQAEAGEQKRVRRSVPVFHYLQTDLV